MHTQSTLENLFITGASGFLGQSILKNLKVGSFKKIYALCRSGLPTELMNDKSIHVIRASLSEVDKYQQYLTPATTVIHCAAATGKCSKNDFFDVNTEGTRHILQASSRQGVGKFLHISTVAVTFDDINHYHYATSKREAENCVKKSPLQYIILRPTVILGRCAPQCALLKRLTIKKIALLPAGGHTTLQPIHVDDLANAIIHLVLHEPFSGEVIEIGGNDVLSLRDFIGKLNGDNKTLNIPIPIKPLELLLLMLERVGIDFLPVTAGQLGFFKNNIVARKSDKNFEIKNQLSDLIEGCKSDG
jgi:nucleoside-diphosphate-sugar epimerase